MKNNQQILDTILKKLDRIPYISSDEIPKLELYMDQLTTFMEEHLKEAKRVSEDKILTKTMINNYAKNRLLPAPNKKKYGKDHILLLIFIYYYKNLLSFSDIERILAPLSDEHFTGKKSSGIELEEIYSRIQTLISESIPSLKEEIREKFAKADAVYPQDDSDNRYPALFTFMSELAFDIYIKKQIIQTISDLLPAREEKP